MFETASFMSSRTSTALSREGPLRPKIAVGRVPISQRTALPAVAPTDLAGEDRGEAFRPRSRSFRVIRFAIERSRKFLFHRHRRGNRFRFLSGRRL